MATPELSSPKPYAVLVPDAGASEQHPNPSSVEQGAGFLELGFEVNGVRVRLARVKAGGFLDDLKRAQASE